MLIYMRKSLCVYQAYTQADTHKDGTGMGEQKEKKKTRICLAACPVSGALRFGFAVDPLSVCSC